jgi:hypothetical protein
LRYFDGSTWTQHVAPRAAKFSTPTAAIVQKPNHALHFVLTLFTFWACGGWAWIWLFVALGHKKTVHPHDGRGHAIEQRNAR